MELRINPAAHSKYTQKAILIKGADPKFWFRELDELDIDVREIEAFGVPSKQTNVLYGCLLIFKKDLPKDTRNHKRFQCAYNKIFIPENASLYPQLTPTDITSIKAEWIIAHPDFGFVDLEEAVDWLDLLEEVPTAERQLRQPMEGIAVPDKILSYSVELDEEDMANSLLPQKTEEEWMKDLPFNLKKVLNGNKKEAEKYLKYLAQYPERALALGIPLDVMNTSRDSGWASFNFRSGWLQSMFGGGFGGGSGGELFGGASDSGSGGSSVWQYLRIIAIGLAIVFLLGLLLERGDSNYVKDRSIGPIPAAATVQEDSLKNEYKDILAAPQKDSLLETLSKDTLEERRKTLRSKYLLAVYKYGNSEVQQNKIVKDSMRASMDEMELQMRAVSDQIAAKEAGLRDVNRQKVVTELAKAEKKIRRQIKDSIAKLPQSEPQELSEQNALYESALNSKKASLRDSLELAYGLRVVQEDTFIPGVQEFPADEPVPQRSGTFVQLIFLMIGLLIGVLIFAKVIKGKTISMGGHQVPAGLKIFVALAFCGMLAYILYPLIERHGYNWLVWLILLAAVALMYRLLASDKTILKSDKNG